METFVFTIDRRVARERRHVARAVRTARAGTTALELRAVQVGSQANALVESARGLTSFVLPKSELIRSQRMLGGFVHQSVGTSPESWLNETSLRGKTSER